MSCRYLMISSGAAIQRWLNSVYLSPYWWLIEYWMTAILVNAYLYYFFIRFPLVTLKATNSNYWVGKRLPLITLKATNSNYWAGKRLPLITFYYLNGFLCHSITLITLNGKSLPIKEMAPYNRHDPFLCCCKNLLITKALLQKVIWNIIFIWIQIWLCG